MNFFEVIITSVVISSLTIYGYAGMHNRDDVNKGMFVFPDAEKSQCVADSINTTLNIVFGVEFNGEFENDDSKILAKQKGNYIYLSKDAENVGAVAHEVSHFVDYEMQQKGLIGTESEAYMQGYFTECVWNLILEKQSLAGG